MAREIKCKDCGEAQQSVWHLTQHKIEAHGYKKKKPKKRVEEAPPVDAELDLIANCIAWFDASGLDSEACERVVNYLHARYVSTEPVGAA